MITLDPLKLRNQMSCSEEDEERAAAERAKERQREKWREDPK